MKKSHNSISGDFSYIVVFFLYVFFSFWWVTEAPVKNTPWTENDLPMPAAPSPRVLSVQGVKLMKHGQRVYFLATRVNTYHSIVSISECNEWYHRNELKYNQQQQALSHN